MKSPPEKAQWEGSLAARSRGEEMSEKGLAKETLKVKSQACQKIDNTWETCNTNWKTVQWRGKIRARRHQTYSHCNPLKLNHKSGNSGTYFLLVEWKYGSILPCPLLFKKHNRNLTQIVLESRMEFFNWREFWVQNKEVLELIFLILQYLLQSTLLAPSTGNIWLGALCMCYFHTGCTVMEHFGLRNLNYNHRSWSLWGFALQYLQTAHSSWGTTGHHRNQ